METRAKARFIRRSPKKIRLVANLIRGLDVEAALVQLKFSTKAAAEPIAKLLKSAISNAEENNKLKRNNLFIKEIKVDEGPVLKRWAPRAFGRATPIRKGSSHIILTLSERVPTEVKKEEIKKKESKNDDIIKVDDWEELKKSDKAKEEKSAGLADKSTSSKSSKGFVKRILNRRSGQK